MKPEDTPWCGVCYDELWGLDILWYDVEEDGKVFKLVSFFGFRTGVGNCPIFSHHPNIGDIYIYNLQQILEGDVQNPQNGTFTKPCRKL